MFAFGTRITLISSSSYGARITNWTFDILSISWALERIIITCRALMMIIITISSAGVIISCAGVTISCAGVGVSITTTFQL